MEVLSHKDRGIGNNEGGIMSLPPGYKYYNNMAIYPIRDLPYAEDYGENLESRYDKAEKALYKERIFCLDCFYFEACRGRCWLACPYKAIALRIIRG